MTRTTASAAAERPQRGSTLSGRTPHRDIVAGAAGDTGTAYAARPPEPRHIDRHSPAT